MNINRDYLIINDVKKSNIKLDNGSMFFYITDKNTQNIFVNLVINVSNNDLIQKYANIENAEDYTLTMNIVKPDNTYKVIEGKLHDKEKAIFEFDLEEDCVDKIGPYRCELLTKCTINDCEEITTSNKLTYKVKSSVLNDLDDIVEAPEYPLVIQLFDKLSDIEQYEEDRRANELARQLAEEQREARFNALDADMTDRVTAMDNKMVDVENRMTAKEQAVDTLIVDAKADIDEYKVAKDQEIDDYKTAKDQEINNAITAQDNKIDEAISNQNDRITVVENNVATQNNRLDIVENKNQQQDNKLNDIEAKNVEQDNRLDEIEAIDVAQNTRLDAIEIKNQQQDDRLLDIEKVNKRQDIDLKCLFTEAKNNMMDITGEGNSVYLQNSTEGHVFIDEIKGNTLVNCNKEPDKELILNGNINTSGDSAITLTECVDGGLVDVTLEGNTLVNVSKTKDSTALPLEEELTYLYANTQYTVQFISDRATTAGITLGGTQLLAQSIVKGLNRINITTPATLTNNKLIISGVGANISEVVVTDTDREFGYFEGMKSVGECEGNTIEILSQNKNLFDTNLLKVRQSIYGYYKFNPNRKDMTLSLIDKDTSVDISGIHIGFTGNGKDANSGFKWLINRGGVLPSKAITSNMSCISFYPNNQSTLDKLFARFDFQLEEGDIATDHIPHQSNAQQLTHEPLRAVGNVKDRYVLIDGKWYIERNCGTRTYQEGDTDSYKTDLVNTVYPLDTPIYEPIDYNPLEVYSEVTHITTNSTIPCNVTVKNHGYNCLLKPSTTYTISSNLGLNTVTTPSTLTEDCLRFMDTDTSDVTTMRDVLVLEGDWTTKADLIPANFSGIESAFEQEYDAEKGKYKVNVKVANEDKSKENNITFYINEPLRGIGDTRDRVFIKDDKAVVQRNCVSVTVNGDNCIRYDLNSDTPNYLYAWIKIPNLKYMNQNNIIANIPEIDFNDRFKINIGLCYYRISVNYENVIILKVPSFKLESINIEGIKRYIDSKNIKMVYELAEPTYEEVEYDDVKLFVESFKNSTLFYNSNVPVTSKLYYSYSVPIVDTVAQTANVTDQQDSMIIDLATQVAVMEMMLM